MPRLASRMCTAWDLHSPWHQERCCTLLWLSFQSCFACLVCALYCALGTVCWTAPYLPGTVMAIAVPARAWRCCSSGADALAGAVNLPIASKIEVDIKQHRLSPAGN